MDKQLHQMRNLDFLRVERQHVRPFERAELNRHGASDLTLLEFAKPRQ